MSRAAVNAGRRMSIVADRALTAGDFIYFQGFYGTVDDDAAIGDYVALILDGGVRELKNIYGGPLARGTKMFAAPTTLASTLLLYPAGSVPSGANAIGRAWATGVASSATATLQVALFHPNEY